MYSLLFRTGVTKESSPDVQRSRASRPAMSATAVNSGSARGVKDKRGGYSTLNLNYKGGGRGGDTKGYGMSNRG